MITVEGLEMPDLRPYFKHYNWRVMPHSQGQLVGSDWSDKAPGDPFWDTQKNCGSWTMGEAAILYNVARLVRGRWLDIGGHTGWTAAHLLAAGCTVTAVDPEYSRGDFEQRACENLAEWTGWGAMPVLWSGLSQDFFERDQALFSGIVIDGDHSAPAPLLDAVFARMRVLATGVILFHDARGEPIKQGIRHVVRFRGWHVRLYQTPHGVALCYQDGFTPPEHVPGPKISEYSL